MKTSFLLINLMLTSMIPSLVTAAEATIQGSAYYLERISLPENALYTAILEDASLMDVAAIQLGTDSGAVQQIPINFSISYNPALIQKGHRYNIRFQIRLEGKLLFTTDTFHPVLTGQPQTELKLKLKKI